MKSPHLLCLLNGDVLAISLRYAATYRWLASLGADFRAVTPVGIRPVLVIPNPRGSTPFIDPNVQQKSTH